MDSNKMSEIETIVDGFLINLQDAKESLRKAESYVQDLKEILQDKEEEEF